MKDSKKNVSFLKKDDKDNVLYSWIIDGSHLSNVMDIKTDVSFSFSDVDKFDSLVGYRKGIYLKFSQNSFPNSTSISIPVDKSFKDGDTVLVYVYNTKNSEVQLREKKVTVQNGKLQLSISKGEKYFFIIAIIENAETTNFNIYKVIFIAISNNFWRYFEITIYLM